MNRLLGMLAAGALTTGQGMAQDEPARLSEPLAPLEFLAGSCWHGVFPDGERFDIHCFESAYGGHYLRDVHAVPGAGGTYRGETLYHFDAEAGVIRYRYFNSLGGVSDGTARPAGEAVRFPDEVHRAEDGSEMVIATTWQWDGADSYLATSNDVSDPDAAVELFVMRFERITREEAESLIEGGL